MLHSALAETSIHFQPRIKSQAKTLGELVVISPAHPEWSALALEGPLHAGQRLEKASIRQWFISQTGEKELHWLGKKSAQVEVDRATLGQTLGKFAQKELETQLQAEGYEKVVVTALSEVKDSIYPLNEFKALINLRQPVQKQICVHLNHKQEHHRIWFKIEAWRRVAVTQKELKANQGLQDEDIRWLSRNIAGLRVEPVSSIPARPGVIKNLAANHILMSGDLAPLAEIKVGDEVSVAIKRPPIQIELTAQAVEEGRMGERIQLKNAQSQKLFYARVTGVKQAEVSL